MSPVTHLPRRLFILSGTCAMVSGCGTVPFIAPKSSNAISAQQTLDSYFKLLAANKYDNAKQLMTASFQSKLGRAGVDALLHSIQSVQVTDVVDAVAWANQLGAHLPASPADRREYLVTLQIDPSSDGRSSWSVGTNRRFVDLLRQQGIWKIDAIAVTPGVLVTGEAKKSLDQNTVILPTSPLRLGAAPVDRAIYTARQDAADHGAIPWATDPIQVVHRDGPSFGLNPSDPAEGLRHDVDPSSLVPRVSVVVHQGEHAYLVTLIQPIRAGKGGIWAIADVEAYKPLGT